MAKDLDYYLSQARRISEHREVGSEKEIRRIFKSTLRDVNTFLSETYVQYGEDDRLTFGALQSAGYNARFLEEIEQRMNVTTPKVAEEVRRAVEQTYEAAYTAMVQGVAKASGGLDEVFAEAVAITPEQIRKTVDNPLMETALSKNHTDSIYNIKQAVAVGLMNGDRFTTVAKRLGEVINVNYNKAVQITRTETHRVREAGNVDAAMAVDAELQNGTTGMRMVKIWKTMKDERVRPQYKSGKKHKMGSGANHMRLEGQTVLADEPFDLGHHGFRKVEAMAPGQSGVAGHDINCRCYVSYKMMTDEEYFRETGKHFPGYTEKGIANSGKSSIMNLQLFANRSIPKQSDTGLRKSIASWNQRIEEHQNRIKNPMAYDAGWDSKTDVQKAGLIRHWQKEINNFTKDISEAEAELARRGS